MVLGIWVVESAPFPQDASKKAEVVYPILFDTNPMSLQHHPYP